MRRPIDGCAWPKRGVRSAHTHDRRAITAIERPDAQRAQWRAQRPRSARANPREVFVADVIEERYDSPHT